MKRHSKNLTAVITATKSVNVFSSGSVYCTFESEAAALYGLLPMQRNGFKVQWRHQMSEVEDAIFDCMMELAKQ
jgi:hypothetical protein